ncbi:hypothetical protein O6P43_021782 [Quillaja saponaria]|uniref:Uncharacterized protein n=1 Tax=Quillaja saponaria TaxID=32244 RepID=A0AAD7LBQ3_QUISA|nr:hypothetical protein O6P43_021782 [Quillaja saponaria]
MASQADHLAKVGLEGFALIDKLYGRPKRSNRFPPTQNLCQYQYHPSPIIQMKQEHLKCNETVERFSTGFVIMDNRNENMYVARNH